MPGFSGKFAAGSAVLLGLAMTATSAFAQEPLAVVVRPVTTIISAPFNIVGSVFSPAPVGTYDPEPAERAAVAHTSYGWAVVQPSVLKQTGPRYENPVNADWSRPVVLRKGSTVPAYVPTAPVANISTPGMYTNASYDFFVSPNQRVVFLNPTTREVVKIVR